MQRDPLIHEAGRSRGAVAILITDSNSDIIAQAHSSPVDRSPTANVPLERRVFGCVGRSRPKREGQRCTLRCLFVPLAKVLILGIYTNMPFSVLDTHLADRTATLTTPINTAASPAVDQKPSVPRAPQRTISGTAVKNQTADASPTELLNTTRAELSDAQRSRSELQEKLNRVTTEVEKLRKKNTQDARRINALESERQHLNSRLKDRDEELRGKAKLLEVRHHLWMITSSSLNLWLTLYQDFQDEMATLNLQLNMADQKSNKLQHENQELVDRWMARMGLEADAMNDASKFS